MSEMQELDTRTAVLTVGAESPPPPPPPAGLSSIMGPVMMIMMLGVVAGMLKEGS